MTIALTNATLVDPLRKTLQQDVTVLIEGYKIVKVTHDSSEIPREAETIDCNEKFLLPGLMDMHVHLTEGKQSGDFLKKPQADLVPTLETERKLISRLHSYFYCGVTSVFDAGNIAPKLYFLRGAEREGRIVSPRIFCAGWFVTCPGGHGSPLATEISSVSEVAPRLKSHLEGKPDLVKITYEERNWSMNPLIPILEKETLKQIIDFCHSNGFRVTVHTSNEFRSREAIECNADTLAHTVIQSPITQEFADLLEAKKVPVVTTIDIGASYPRLAEHPEYLDGPFYEECLDKDEREYLRRVESPKQSKSRHAAWMKVMTPVLQDNIRRIQENDGIVVTGTDGTCGPDYMHELELLQEAGVSDWGIIIAGTRNGSIFLGKEDLLGSIEPGRLADMILVDEDPTKDIRNLKKISMVMKDGNLIDRQKLDLPVNRAPEL
ncbi:MAG: amidohydrolase family protein [Nitrososphaerales archaeon]